RVEPSVGGEGLRLYEAPSPPIAVSTLRPQKIWGYAGGKLRFDFDFRVISKHRPVISDTLLLRTTKITSSYATRRLTYIIEAALKTKQL
ncbi:MAG: hypothetical protein U0M50_00520, partial [Paramuribaculum sp.]